MTLGRNFHKIANSKAFKRPLPLPSRARVKDHQTTLGCGVRHQIYRHPKMLVSIDLKLNISGIFVFIWCLCMPGQQKMTPPRPKSKFDKWRHGLVQMHPQSWIMHPQSVRAALLRLRGTLFHIKDTLLHFRGALFCVRTPSSTSETPSSTSVSPLSTCTICVRDALFHVRGALLHFRVQRFRSLR